MPVNGLNWFKSCVVNKESLKWSEICILEILFTIIRYGLCRFCREYEESMDFVQD